MELTETLSVLVARETSDVTPEEAVRHIGQFRAAYLRLFGCWHLDMGRPITLRQRTYRVCLDCGAHRAFDTEKWRMIGPFFCLAVPQTEAQVKADLHS